MKSNSTKITDPIWTENSIRTFTGKCFDLKILDPDSICIEDIAHGLAHTARFAGQLRNFYNVAQHSWHVAMHVPEKHRLAALLHDASEAYLGDMPSPFKKMMPDYKKLEEKLMKAIALKFGFDWPLHPCIKKADNVMLKLEWQTFVEYQDVLPLWPPFAAKKEFLNMFDQFYK